MPYVYLFECSKLTSKTTKDQKENDFDENMLILLLKMYQQVEILSSKFNIMNLYYVQISKAKKIFCSKNLRM